MPVVFCILFIAAAFLPGLQKQARGEVKEGKTAGEEKSGEMAAPKEASFTSNSSRCKKMKL